MTSPSPADYEALCREIWQHNRRYYIDNNPIINDEEFDRLYKRLKQLELQHPEWIRATSPTQRIGEMLTEGFATVAHKSQMLSLENCYSRGELEEFTARMERLTESKKLSYCCELKIDGVAITVCYRRGKFVRAATRGDGKMGDEISNNVKTIKNLPLELCGDDIPELLEVRGEVFMTQEVFEEINRKREAEGEELWANPRNAASGTLKLLDPQKVARRHLSILFYAIAPESTLKPHSQYEVHRALSRLGLPTLSEVVECHSQGEIEAFAAHILQMRGKLPFGIDGIVVKLNDLQAQKMLGATAKHPRWAIAYKFAAEQATTQVKDITLQVGRSGVLTPVAELHPVSLAGSTISRATLHNAEEVQRKDIRVGDTVYIEKGGDVIPKVVKVVLELRPKESEPWQMPLVCPVCGSAVVRAEGAVAVRCPNKNGCPAQSLRRLAHFASKVAMDIDDMGEKVIEKLVEKGFVTTPSDIYKLTAEQLAQLEGFKAKSIANLLSSIQRSRHVPLSRFIMALGIKHVGSNTAAELARKLGSVERLLAIDSAQLQNIEGVGEKVSASIVEYFSDGDCREEVERLLQLGVTPLPENSIAFTAHPFQGKLFALTGALRNFTRLEAVNKIKERGGRISEAVGKKTDYLLVGDDPGSKLTKARNLSIELLSEEQFELLL